jgi:RNA polymerase sigma-70 factor, ECF subfamily
MAPTDQPTGGSDLTDAETFGRWYADHWLAAVARARHLTRDDALAEDVAAEAMLRAWQRWQVTGTPDRPWPYVLSAIRNVAVTHFRRREMERERLTRFLPVSTPSPEDGIVDRQTVLELVPQLPEQERAAVVLCYLADVPSTEVAERLAMRPGTVRSHLHRARRRLAASAVA